MDCHLSDAYACMYVSMYMCECVLLADCDVHAPQYHFDGANSTNICYYTLPEVRNIKVNVCPEILQINSKYAVSDIKEALRRIWPIVCKYRSNPSPPPTTSATRVHSAPSAGNASASDVAAVLASANTMQP
jgi:hypothetical protein